jgi:hypothetical protein
MPENEVQKNSETQKNDDDEISLVDLFVVLLQYRRLILKVVIAGIIAAVCVYAVLVGKSKPSLPELKEKYEGSMTVIINPRLGTGFQSWFNSKDLITKSIEDAGLPKEAVTALSVNYGGGGVNFHFKPGVGEKEQIEKLFSLLLENAEAMADDYYKRYAEDIIAYVESDQFEVTGADYARYRWAKEFMAGTETVLQTLYPPLIEEEEELLERSSLRQTSVVIVIASFFLAVFLAFVLNAFKNIRSDREVIAKIHGALGKETKDGE